MFRGPAQSLRHQHAGETRLRHAGGVVRLWAAEIGLVGLEMDEVQMRQGHWAVVDLIGKGGAFGFMLGMGG